MRDDGETRLLICTDLDRTLLPNGDQAESPEARPRFRKLAARPEVTVAYVSGRRRELIAAAIDEFGVPVPAFVVGDVGTSIYRIEAGEWIPDGSWSEEIARDWNGRVREDLERLLSGIAGLRPQEPESQGRFKLSYYASSGLDPAALRSAARERLEPAGVRASLIWSVDETDGIGLFDVLPENATKEHAARFLMEREGFSEARTVFAGDSGNDIPALTSGLQAVLVGNATKEVREEAVRRAEAAGVRDSLYLARGGFMGMNGNYAAGILEGVAHFVPEAARWCAD